MALFEHEAIVVNQLGAGLDRLDRLDEDLVAFADGFAIRRAAVIDPPRIVAADRGVASGGTGQAESVAGDAGALNACAVSAISDNRITIFPFILR